jgi:hypothetical protein
VFAVRFEAPTVAATRHGASTSRIEVVSSKIHRSGPLSSRCWRLTLVMFNAMRLDNHIHRTPVRSTAVIVALLLASLIASAQQPATAEPVSHPTMASMMEAQLGMVERQFVSAAEAMPDDKYSFAPAGSNFSGVRTFALEVRHVATANFAIYSAILGEDPPPGVTMDGAANGPETLQTKQQIVQYLKDSFTLGHRAMRALTNDNALAPLDKLPIAIPSVNTRLALAILSFSHANDHYGQMVEYLHMNDIVPPASVGQPPANPPAK